MTTRASTSAASSPTATPEPSPRLSDGSPRGGGSPRTLTVTAPPAVPAGTSVSAPSDVGRLSATHQQPTNHVELNNTVLSDVAEEDTDIEDRHISTVYYMYSDSTRPFDWFSAVEGLSVTFTYSVNFTANSGRISGKEAEGTWPRQWRREGFCRPKQTSMLPPPLVRQIVSKKPSPPLRSR